MSHTIISVENLSKKYLVGHKTGGQNGYRYAALRDVIGRSLVRRIGSCRFENGSTLIHQLPYLHRHPAIGGAQQAFGLPVDLILAGMIFLGLPATAAWAIGLLVGINLIFGGSALMAIALNARPGASV